MAQALADAGVGPNDRVAFLDKNGIEHFDVSFGAAMLNAVSVDVNWRLAAPEVQFIVDDAEAKVLIVGPDFVPVLDAIVDQLPKVHKFVVIGGHPTHESYDDWVGRFPADDPGVQSHERRHRVPAVLVGDDGAAEGRDAQQRQPVRAAADGEGHVGDQRARR